MHPHIVRHSIVGWLVEAVNSLEITSKYTGHPNVGSHVAMSNIRRRFAVLCRRCGLQGKEFHPHALAHQRSHLA